MLIRTVVVKGLEPADRMSRGNDEVCVGPIVGVVLQAPVRFTILGAFEANLYPPLAILCHAIYIVVHLGQADWVIEC